MTVFYKKSAVLKAGGYEDFPAMEDYHLWVKMLLLNFRLVNLPENFVLQRANQKMFARRPKAVRKFRRADSSIQKKIPDS